MLSFGILFFSLEIMVPRAPQAVAGGETAALEGGAQAEPGGARWPAPAGEGRPGKLRLERAASARPSRALAQHAASGRAHTRDPGVGVGICEEGGAGLARGSRGGSRSPCGGGGRPGERGSRAAEEAGSAPPAPEPLTWRGRRPAQSASPPWGGAGSGDGDGEGRREGRGRVRPGDPRARPDAAAQTPRQGRGLFVSARPPQAPRTVPASRAPPPPAGGLGGLRSARAAGQARGSRPPLSGPAAAAVPSSPPRWLRSARGPPSRRGRGLGDSGSLTVSVPLTVSRPLRLPPPRASARPSAEPAARWCAFPWHGSQGARSIRDKRAGGGGGGWGVSRCLPSPHSPSLPPPPRGPPSAWPQPPGAHGGIARCGAGGCGLRGCGQGPADAHSGSACCLRAFPPSFAQPCGVGAG